MEKPGGSAPPAHRGENKGFDPFSPQSPTQRGYAQRMLDQIHQQFIAAVKKGRASAQRHARDLQRPVLDRPAGR